MFKLNNFYKLTTLSLCSIFATIHAPSPTARPKEAGSQAQTTTENPSDLNPETHTLDQPHTLESLQDELKGNSTEETIGNALDRISDWINWNIYNYSDDKAMIKVEKCIINLKASLKAPTTISLTKSVLVPLCKIILEIESTSIPKNDRRRNLTIKLNTIIKRIQSSLRNQISEHGPRSEVGQICYPLLNKLVSSSEEFLSELGSISWWSNATDFFNRKVIPNAKTIAGTTIGSAIGLSVLISMRSGRKNLNDKIDTALTEVKDLAAKIEDQLQAATIGEARTDQWITTITNISKQGNIFLTEGRERAGQYQFLTSTVGQLLKLTKQLKRHTNSPGLQLEELFRKLSITLVDPSLQRYGNLGILDELMKLLETYQNKKESFKFHNCYNRALFNQENRGFDWLDRMGGLITLLTNNQGALDQLFSPGLKHHVDELGRVLREEIRTGTQVLNDQVTAVRGNLNDQVTAVRADVKEVAKYTLAATESIANNVIEKTETLIKEALNKTQEEIKLTRESVLKKATDTENKLLKLIKEESDKLHQTVAETRTETLAAAKETVESALKTTSETIAETRKEVQEHLDATENKVKALIKEESDKLHQTVAATRTETLAAAKETVESALKTTSETIAETRKEVQEHLDATENKVKALIKEESDKLHQTVAATRTETLAAAKETVESALKTTSETIAETRKEVLEHLDATEDKVKEALFKGSQQWLAGTVGECRQATTDYFKSTASSTAGAVKSTASSAAGAVKSTASAATRFPYLQAITSLLANKPIQNTGPKITNTKNSTSRQKKRRTRR